jgi:hypothetical protein
VRRALDEVASIISYVMNNLNGTYILVTADHGFLFTESAPSEPEKSHLDGTPSSTTSGTSWGGICLARKASGTGRRRRPPRRPGTWSS